MKKLVGVTVLVLMPLMLAACGSDDEGGGGSGSSLISHAGKIAPQLTISSGLTTQAKKTSDFSTLAYVDPAGLSADVKTVIGKFLKFGCHSSDLSVNFCSKYGITVTGDPFSSPYLLEMDFMGLMSLFGMKFDDVFMYPAEVPNCGRANATAKSPSFSGSTALMFGANGGFSASLGCVGQANYGTGDTPYMAYSKSTEKESFVTSALGSSGQGSYFYQGYVRKDSAGVPQIFAFNVPSRSGVTATRTLFVGNFQTNRIALKTYSLGSTGFWSAISVIGVGGRTESGNVQGFYGLYAKNHPSAGSDTDGTVCVNNGTATMVDGTNCTDSTISGWLDGTTTAAQIKEYLGVTAEDDVIIGDWFNKLATSAILTNSDVPASDANLISAIQ